MKWLSKAVPAVYWFNCGVQTGIIVVEHLKNCKWVKQRNDCMSHQNMLERANLESLPSV